MAEDEHDSLGEDEGESEALAKDRPAAADRQLEKAFQDGRLRVLQDRNDFFLPHVVDFVKDNRWANLRPEYQRRLRWDDHKRSRLIESLIMNVPVPPVFLYEISVGQFEVMDGQQRISAISDFFSGKFSLRGLRIWTALNGRTHGDLPPLIQNGLKRAKISAITLTVDDLAKGPDEVDLRAQVFERLNTGGEKLNAQELRNCLYSGPFNTLLRDLAGMPTFTKAFGIPSHESHLRSDGSASADLASNKLYATMGDCQIVLRFFAFQRDENIRGSTRAILDRCMRDLRYASVQEIGQLATQFSNTFDLAVRAFGDVAFHLPPSGKQPRRISRALYDAQMVAMLRLSDRASEILAASKRIRDATTSACKPDSAVYRFIVGRPNTSDAIRMRISEMERLVLEAL